MKFWKKSAVIVASVVTMAASGCASQPEYCAAVGKGSFQDLVGGTWRPYCGELTLHVERPSDYEFQELTSFFGAHPEKMRNLKDQLVRFPGHDQCFVDNKERFEYIELNSCLDEDAQAARIFKAWEVAGLAWVEEHEWRARSIGPKLDEIRREMGRLNGHLERHFDNRSPAATEPYAALEDQMFEVRSEIDKLLDATERFEKIAEAAAGWPALFEVVMQGKVGQAMASIEQQTAGHMQTFMATMNDLRFMSYAAHAVGKACPTSSSRARELNVVRKLVREKNPGLNPDSATLKTSIQSEEKGPLVYERFTASACGPRGEEQQFEGRRQLCSVYEISLERSKTKDARRWDDWKITKISEGSLEQGVDCNLF